MDTCGIVAEYNPFHLGHQAQLAWLGERLPGAAVIVVMSPWFTQRGEPAVLDPWTRARLAVQAGCSLVLELPQVFAMSSASAFADGAVATLAASGVCRRLCFGSETADLAPLAGLAEALDRLEADPELEASARTRQKEGLSYAAAREELIIQTLGAGAAAPLRQPNDILGICYLRALARLAGERRMEPLTHPRLGPAEQLQAGLLRGALARADNPRQLAAALDGLVPAQSAAALMAAAAGRLPLVREGAAGSLAYSLLLREEPERLAAFSGMQDGLAGRLRRAAVTMPAGTPRSGLWPRLVDAGVARHLSRARVQRALAALLLNLTADTLAAQLAAGPQYLRVLAFDRRGRYLLRLMRRTARLPVITKTSDFLEYSASGPDFACQYRLDLLASEIWSILAGRGSGADFDTLPAML
ncbi:MAG: nucleotidyltransferase family protein [Bacillota bacterium]|nr:nucleotidyltransferase family protein [Bacillota bacterium]